MMTYPTISSTLLLTASISVSLLTASCSRTAVRTVRATAAVSNVVIQTGLAVGTVVGVATQPGAKIRWAPGWVDDGGGGALLRVVSGGSDKCLSVPAGGARLVQYHCHDGAYQLWRLSMRRAHQALHVSVGAQRPAVARVFTVSTGAPSRACEGGHTGACPATQHPAQDNEAPL
jgi:hypothetical protein